MLEGGRFGWGMALLLVSVAMGSGTPSRGANAAKTRLVVIGLNHDHVWGLLRDIAQVPDAELVAIADPHPELVARARREVSPGVRFFNDYLAMIDAVQPDAAVVATENDQHRAILQACAARHINMMTEKPMATTAADAREMERLARAAHIKLMVNYWNAWAASTHELFHRVHAGELGPVEKIIVRYGHQGPREIGVSKEFAAWLYDPVKNGGGALFDFGCYGAELALWLKGRPTSVYARTLKLKTGQHNAVDDDALVVLEYPDATAILQASWDWPYSEGEVEVFGPKGSLLATQQQLYYRPAGSPESQGANGQRVALAPPPLSTGNPVAYLVDRIRTGRPIEDPVSARLNVEVNEILEAARESIRSGRRVALAAPGGE